MKMGKSEKGPFQKGTNLKKIPTFLLKRADLIKETRKRPISEKDQSQKKGQYLRKV
jgi:hypothetical protein